MNCLLSFFSVDGSSGDGRDNGLLNLGKPDDVDVSIELKDWLFALEGAQEMAERWWFHNDESSSREERCWHTTFQSLQVKAKSSPKQLLNGKGKSQQTQKYPVEAITVSTLYVYIFYIHTNFFFQPLDSFIS